MSRLFETLDRGGHDPTLRNLMSEIGVAPYGRDPSSLYGVIEIQPLRGN